jgi:hypothetical protein
MSLAREMRAAEARIFISRRQKIMPVFVQIYPVIVILNAVKNPCIFPEVP